MKKSIFKSLRYGHHEDRKAESFAISHHHDIGGLIDVLKSLQSERGGLSQETLLGVAKAFNVSIQHVNSVASFYSMLETENPQKTIRVCDGPVCWLKGAADLAPYYNWLKEDGWVIERNSCLGLCDHAPAALVGEVQVGNLTEDIISWRVEDWEQVYSLPDLPKEGETRVLLADVDKIDPTDIQTAIEAGVFDGLKNALKMSPNEVVQIVKDSKLVGRGGAGFPTGLKWSFVAGVEESEKFIVCNADESEPLAVKDRVLIDRNPYLILAGMAIAGFAVGADHGIIYIRGEYPAQAKILEHAIIQAEERHLLGENLLGSGVSFHIHVHSGAGAYICGEETALLESLEGRRGEPRLRPPYPTTHGYKGKPTVVNNVETFSNVPVILRYGAEWYKNLSNSEFTGTKLYAIFGHVAEPCVFEAPFGLTLSQMINNFGGGMEPFREFGFALVGGAAGRFVPEKLIHLPLDYASGDKGAHIGVGAALVCDVSVSPVALLRELLHFFEVESCGKCTPCRVGTRHAREILDELVAGGAPLDSIERLHELSTFMGAASFCGLGISVPWPVASALEHFEEAFEARLC